MSALDLGHGEELGLEDPFGMANADRTQQQVELDNTLDIALSNMGKNCVSELFFSKRNMEALQLGMRNRVANATNGEEQIGNQSETELLIIMRAIYFEYSVNQPDNVLQQVRDLNKKVLEETVRLILREIEQYRTYIRDASQMYTPIHQPVNVSNKGSKILFRETLW